MNKKIRYLSAVVSVLVLFTACDILGSAPEQRSWPEEKAAVSVRIAAEGAQARTLKPDVVLQDTAWELLGGQDDTQSLLAEFSGTEGATINIDPGTWNFTLNGYKDSALILSGSLEGQTISLTGTNTLAFTVAPIMEGDGTVRIVIELPSGSGITSAQVLWGSAEPATLTPSANSIVFEGTYSAGTYYFSVRLYKDAELYGVVSEAVHVWAHLQSEKTYTLTLENLNLTYIISYHVMDTEVEFGYYQRTDPKLTLPLPFRQGYVFRGWYESADFSGDALTEIPAGSTGDRDVYAKWITAEQTTSSTLAEFLVWISVNAEDGGAYAITLNADETIDPTMLHYGDKTIDIVLNGGSAERTVTLGSSGSLFIVNNGVTLALGPNVTLQGRSNTAALLRVNAGGTLTMDAGAKISGNSSSDGGGVYVNGGAFTMNDGEISDNRASSGGGVYVSSGAFTMNAGEISGNTASSSSGGGGVYVGGGAFTMSGGEISDNISAYGGGVYVNYGTFTMTGGEISGNSGASYGGGGGVYVYGGTFTMSGGEISGNTASSSSGGDGVYVNHGTFTMSGGEISGNTASSSSGGGVYVGSSGTFTMNAGAISGNNGRGVYVWSGTFTMNAGAISDNNSSGVYVDSSGTFTMNDGTISGNKGDGVYVANGTFTKYSGGTIYGVNADSALRNNGYAAYVSSGPKIRNTTAGIGVSLNSGVSGLAGGWETALPSDYSLAQSLTWLNANAEEGGAYTITLSANEPIAPQTLSYSGKNITITLKGDSTERAISLNVPGSLFTVESGVTLMLGNRVTLQGRSGNTASLLVVNNGATLMMNSGSKISGNQNTSSSGGGVYVSSGGAFLMSGGALSGNTAAYNGGGASIYGAFTMSGGAISNNTASSSGGGVYVDSSGVFTKLVGGVIYGSNADAGLKNTAAAGDDYGHAVYVSSSKKRNGTALSDVTLDSSLSGAAGGWEASIPNNYSLAQSLTWLRTNAANGGVYTITISADESIAPTELYYEGKKVDILLNGGAMERTLSLSSAGSLFTIGSGATLTLGPNVTLQGRSDNTVALLQVDDGGALVMASSSKVSGNTNTAGSGGGVYVSSGGTFTKESGGIVYGSDASGALKNTVSAGDTYGHAVYVEGSPAKVRDTTADSVPLNSSTSGSAGGWETSILSALLADSLTWLSTNAEEGGDYIIVLSDNVSIAPKSLSYSEKTVNITLIGGTTERTLSLSSTGSLFTVESGVSLTLGNNVTLQGLSDNTTRLVQVNSGGTLVMASGSKITGNTASPSYSSSYGGGVYMSGGTFTMNGGEISGNTASSSDYYTYGGGVYMSDGTFTMNGGEISGNTASSSNYYAYGGGVYMSDGTFTMNGGEISGNTASSSNYYARGGGVYVNSGTFIKESGGTIYGSDASDSLKNTASSGDNYGHAVFSEGNKRNSTAGADVTLNSSLSGSSGGWE